eukprot:Blabericola_migrator_1__955@NODE_123_length_13376_cov_72_514539_g109_i0_p13_GENE_NODE_123_length_13376_cov_72_514539_g109_i0NODE_123_length_13376_cov_72_514539_g109_i0_p13_ORF_typecomplete_len109_score24_08OAD_gamma/PF04277_13/4_3e03OAD_gamma/PF04277_13/0_03Jiraiya/PF15038_6/4_3e02Jiraiya/PF15038_6/0_17_NODE_123_length_13376_cov_72_514539_g109_i079648290
MRAVIITESKTSAKKAKALGLPVSAGGGNWLTWSLATAAVVNEATSIIQGYPMLNMMRQGDIYMYLCLMGMGAVFMAVIAVMFIVGTSSRRDHLEFEEDIRPKRKRRH